MGFVLFVVSCGNVTAIIFVSLYFPGLLTERKKNVAGRKKKENRTPAVERKRTYKSR